jgi:hypothetical protein
MALPQPETESTATLEGACDEACGTEKADSNERAVDDLLLRHAPSEIRQVPNHLLRGARRS